MLLPCDLREWVPGDDLVHFIVEAVEQMDLPELRVNHRGSGSPQYPPRMMLALLIYGYAHGVFGSRRIERATHRDLAVRYLTGNTHPDHDTIAKFRRETLAAKLKAARERIEARDRVRVEQEHEHYRVEQAKWEARQDKRGGRPKEPAPRPDPDEQENLVDGGSRLMRKSNGSSCEQCYNAQAVVDAEGSQLVVAARLRRCGVDQPELAENIRAIPAPLGRPERVLADSGYVNAEAVAALEREGIEVYVSPGAESVQQGRRYEFRPERKRRERPRALVAEWLRTMKAKLESEAGRKLYRLRKQTVEPVFGIIKPVMGFRQFLLRGREKVAGEWTLVTLAYNFKRLWTLKQALP